MATQVSPNLYERLGGVYSIATVVDDLIDRVMTDPRLNANPLVDDAHHKVPPAGFKYLVTEMLCWAAGGPQKYTGKDMESSHRHLRITPGEWDAFVDSRLLQTICCERALRCEELAKTVKSPERAQFPRQAIDRSRICAGRFVTRAIRLPTSFLKAGVSNGAISLQYIHSRADLSVLITFFEKRLFSIPF